MPRKKPSESPDSPGSKTAPEATFRLGSISASVFVNQSQAGQAFRSVIFQRSYETTEGDRQFTNSFNVADLPVLERVLRLAQEHVEQLDNVVRSS